MRSLNSDSPEPVMKNYSPAPGNENGCLSLEIDISDVRSSWANLAGISVFFLRIFPTTQHVVHKELERASKIYSQEELKQSFIIVEPGEYRIRRLPSEWMRLRLRKAPTDRTILVDISRWPNSRNYTPQSMIDTPLARFRLAVPSSFFFCSADNHINFSSDLTV